VVISVVNLFAYDSLLHGSIVFTTLGVIRNSLIGVAGVRLLVVGLGFRTVPARSRPLMSTPIAATSR